MEPVIVLLHGYTKQVTAITDLTPAERDILALRYINSLRKEKKPVTQEKVEKITAIVASHCRLTPKEIVRQTRIPNIVRARQLAMYLIKTRTTLSLKQIGDHFGGRDHTTVIHAVKSITEQADVYDDTRQEIDQLLNQIDLLLEAA